MSKPKRKKPPITKADLKFLIGFLKAYAGIYDTLYKPKRKRK